MSTINTMIIRSFFLYSLSDYGGFSSSIQLRIINIPAAGQDPTNCQRAWQRTGFGIAGGSKTTTHMMYDLSADFFVKSGDAQPRYTVLMGNYYPKRLDELESMGFREAPDSTPGYLDYVKETSEEELEKLTQADYMCEMLDVLDVDFDYEKILLRAYEVDVIDDEGNYPPRARMVGDTLITFGYSNPDSPVHFESQVQCDENGKPIDFNVPMRILKKTFEVLTMAEVIKRFDTLAEKRNITFEMLRDCFAPKVITPDNIIPLYGMAEHVAFARKDEYEKDGEKSDYDPIVMYVEKNGAEPDFWFARAHVAETLSPMSLWEINPEMREEILADIMQRIPEDALKEMLRQYKTTLSIEAQAQI